MWAFHLGQAIQCVVVVARAAAQFVVNLGWLAKVVVVKAALADGRKLIVLVAFTGALRCAMRRPWGRSGILFPAGCPVVVLVRAPWRRGQ